jgi:hypothetical protein
MAPDLEAAARALDDAVGDRLEEDRIEADPHWYVRLNVTEDCVSRARDSMCA